MQSKSSLPFSLLLLVGLLGYFGYLIYMHRVPCITTISYELTVYDQSKFKLPKASVEADTRAAAAVWNDALGREVFVEVSTKPDLPVIFSYGELQGTISSLDSLNSSIDAQKTNLTTLANEYGTLKAEYEQAVREGKATQAMVDNLNAVAHQYNLLVKSINSNVTKEQDLPVGDETAGKYVSDQSGTRVYIYGFEDEAELKSTLTHEFGHALGLQHVDDKNAVMYPTDTSSTVTLAPADLAEMNRVCDEAKNSTEGKLYITLKPVFDFLQPYIEQIKTRLAK